MSKYFSFYPEENEFETHDTLQQAKDSAEKSLEFESENAHEYGWSESVTDICYGEILGSPTECMRQNRKDFTQEEWDEMGYSNEWDTVVNYGISDNKKLEPQFSSKCLQREFERLTRGDYDFSKDSDGHYKVRKTFHAWRGFYIAHEYLKLIKE